MKMRELLGLKDLIYFFTKVQSEFSGTDWADRGLAERYIGTSLIRNSPPPSSTVGP